MKDIDKINHIIKEILLMEYKGTFYPFENREDLNEFRTDYNDLLEISEKMYSIITNIRDIFTDDFFSGSSFDELDCKEIQNKIIKHCKNNLELTN